MKGLTQAGRIWVMTGVVAATAAAVLANPAQAQDSTLANGVRVHTVRPGETLWDIAQTYLGDGDLWPEIKRLNRHLVDDPRWIFPNEILQLPPRPAGMPAADNGQALAAAAPAQAAAPAAPAASSAAPPVSAPPAAAIGAPEPDNAPAAVAQQPLPDDAAAPATTPDNDAAAAPGATLFNHPPQGTSMFAGATAHASAIVAHRFEGVNLGDHNSAPYMDRDGGPRDAGAVVGTVDLSSVIDAADVEHFGLGQELYVTMPRGSRAEVGQRYYTYALGESFGDHGQVVVPTGILLVTHAGSGQLATTARIIQEFGYIQRGQGVLAVDASILPNSPPSPVAMSGKASHVVWVESNQVLPTVGYFVLLDASSKSGVRLGDQVTLYRPKEDLDTPNGKVTLPESSIATAQVVRVTPYGASAIIIKQEQPAVEPGVAARITARVNGGQ